MLLDHRPMQLFLDTRKLERKHLLCYCIIIKITPKAHAHHQRCVLFVIAMVLEEITIFLPKCEVALASSLALSTAPELNDA